MPNPSETLFPGDSLFPGGEDASLTLGLIASFAIEATSTHKGSVTLPLVVQVGVATSTAPPSAGGSYPSVTYEVAFDDPPLNRNPMWTPLTTRVRQLSSRRGRSFEFDRMETGTAGAHLDNRDSALSPENTASPYSPIRPTRPVRVSAHWVSAYPLFYGISEGFPQTYRQAGKDAMVTLQASDYFYALNNSRFTPGATTLTAPLLTVPTGTGQAISVATTLLPMPQVAPFTITVEGLTPDWPLEQMTVTEILSPTSYQVTRDADPTYEHPVGSAVATTAVSFGEQMSGQRIQTVLESVGFDSAWMDLDGGQSLIAPSDDLAGVSPLEHINLIADAEFGRFFVSRDGVYTFRDRHSIILDALSPLMTFKDITLLTGAADEVPFSLAGPLDHSDEKLYNRVKITIAGGAYSGYTVDVSDEASIAEHFERLFERTFPYANPNDAEAAARFVLARSSEAMVRLPELVVHGVSDPADLWPLLLAREIGDRCRFRYQPEGGGDEIDRDVIIDGISHAIAPKSHVVSFQCTQVDATQFWILGRAGYTELGTSTRVGF